MDTGAGEMLPKLICGIAVCPFGINGRKPDAPSVVVPSAFLQTTRTRNRPPESTGTLGMLKVPSGLTCTLRLRIFAVQLKGSWAATVVTWTHASMATTNLNQDDSVILKSRLFRFSFIALATPSIISV